MTSEPNSVGTRPASPVRSADTSLFNAHLGYARPLVPEFPRGLQEQDFSSAFEHSAAGMALLDPAARRLRVNQAFCEMLGYSRAELLSLTVADITHPDDVAEYLEQWSRILAGEKDSYQREKRYLHKSGRVVWAHLTCSLVRDGNGAPAHFIVQVLDITERKAAEQGLRDTQATLHLAAQIGKLGAWSYEVADGRMVWSEEICAIHDVKRGFRPTPDQAIEFFVPEQREAMRATLDACLRDGSAFDVEAPIVTAKGQHVWIRVIGEAEWDALGRVRRIRGACQDISEPRRVAADAMQIADQLATTLESLTDAFFTIDRNWRLTYLNSQAERVFRGSRRELLGKSLGELLPHGLDPAFHRHLERAMSDQLVVQCEEHYAPYDVWVQIKAYPSPQGLAIYVKDVTERVAAQQEILRLNAELENRVNERTAQLEAANNELSIANRELEAFSYSVAHDLRGPLATIASFSQILDTTVSELLPERNRNHLRRIVTISVQMDELIEGLLSLAKLSRTSIRHAPVDLATLAGGMLDSLREAAPQRTVEVEIARALPVMGDPSLLSEVISNLVGNAWKFTCKCAHARIEVGSLDGADGAPVYYVRDNGAGFDMAHASKMFEPFQRMHSPAEFEGTGIGLAIVNKIVALHGGRIWAESAPGQGASFHFTLGP